MHTQQFWLSVLTDSRPSGGKPENPRPAILSPVTCDPQCEHRSAFIGNFTSFKRVVHLAFLGTVPMVSTWCALHTPPAGALDQRDAPGGGRRGEGGGDVLIVSDWASLTLDKFKVQEQLRRAHRGDLDVVSPRRHTHTRVTCFGFLF